jgi:hypothetical protein
MRGRLVLVLMAGAFACTPPAGRRAGGSSAAASHVLPVRFIQDRPFATPVTARGDTMLLLLDTGGGANILYVPALERLGATAEWLRQGRDSGRFTPWPSFSAGASIPRPLAASGPGDRLLVLPTQQGHVEPDDGMLGRTWFADRVWVIDYLRRRMMLVGDATLGRLPRATHRVPLGFQLDSAGRRTTHFPRIRVEVDGDSLDLLFDTGATVTLTDSALTALADGGPPARGTSFITQSVFTRWRQRHPDWRVVEGADRILGMPMIQVPRVRIGGHTVGPAWFTMRPDRNFHQYMSQWMDRRIDGALGGSVLRYFRVTLDYPGAAAVFEAGPRS